MKLETIMPFVKIGAGLLLAGAAGSAVTTAVRHEQKPVVECKCNCNHPPIKGELIFKK